MIGLLAKFQNVAYTAVSLVCHGCDRCECFESLAKNAIKKSPVADAWSYHSSQFTEKEICV